MATIAELKGEKIGLCVSGGLDSRTLAAKLRDLDIDVLCFTADLCQPDEEDISHVRERMACCDVETVIVDLKDDMAEACMEVVKAQAHYDGGYWNSTGIARAVTVRGLLEAMRSRGCTVLAHGATGRGNDQLRFERYTNVLAPEMRVYAPWRDPALLSEFPGRAQMVEYLRSKGIETGAATKKHYSTDANLAGLSHEAEDLESLETPCTIVEPTMGVWPKDAPAESEEVALRFERGRVTTINGETMAPLAAMQAANRIAGRNGIGMRNALENRIIGTKSRGVYEAPGMELLAFALGQVYQAVLCRRSGRLFESLSRTVSDQIYDGRYFDPVTRAAYAGINVLAEYATGTVRLELHRGNMHFLSLTDCPASLYVSAHSSMEASGGLNPVSSQGLVEVLSVEARSLAHAGQVSGNLVHQ